MTYILLFQVKFGSKVNLQGLQHPESITLYLGTLIAVVDHGSFLNNSQIMHECIDVEIGNMKQETLQ